MMKNIVDLAGRIFLSLIFIVEAADSILFYQKTRLQMTEYGLTWNEDLFLIISIFLLLMGGLLVLVGYRAKLGAALLVLYWIPVTFIVHAWWTYPLEDQRLQSVLFWKNIAILGGLLMVLVNGAGKFSIKKIFATTKVRQRKY